MKRLFFAATLLLFACGAPTTQNTNNITVSIEPLRYITQQIVGADFTIQVLVPQGSSPETFEPTPSQMKQVANSSMYVSIGLLDFETNLGHAIEDNMPDVQQVKLSEGISLIAGNCSHGDAHDEDAHDDHGHAAHNDHTGHNHSSGVDPHIWSSPKAVRQMAKTLYNAIYARYPDSTKYKVNYDLFVARIDSLDRQLTTLFAGHPHHFMIYHPALTYLARDYGLTQISLENEGKEPAVEHVKRMVDTARKSKDQAIVLPKTIQPNDR